MSDFSSATPQSNINQSQAFAAALQRAKQIAAKIQPSQAQQSSSGGGGGFKRGNDDSDSGPESKRFTSPGSDYGQNNNSNMSSGGGGSGGGGPANMSQALAQAAAVAARLAATAGTTCEEHVRVPEAILGSFNGRGPQDAVNYIQSESGCKAHLCPDQDRVVILRGSRETVSKGREMVNQLALTQANTEVEVILTINMPPPGPSGYPPYQEIMIPGTKVGLVIGKGGDTIKQLQEKTGAKMVIIQDGPNQELIKPLRISGDAQKIEHAKQLVLELIAQKDAIAQQQAARNSMGGGQNNGNFNHFGGGGESCEVFVPKIAVGVVIGKGGDMIRKIQTECGCKLQFIQGKNDEPGDRRCLIQGSRQQVEDAKRMIDGLIDNMMQRSQNNRNGNGGGGGDNSNYGYGYGVNHAQQPAREEITFMVPASKCGIVIGRGGETIKLINQQSGAYTEMDRNAVNPPSEKLFKCKGTSEQVEAARQLIAEKINMEIQIISRKPISGNIPHNQQQQQPGGYNQNAMQSDPSAYQQQQQWGGYAQQGGWGDQAQQQQHQMAGAMGQAAAASNSQDYSAQWIDYYKSMGMTREAEMVEQQLKAKQAVSNAGQQMQVQQQQQATGAAPGGGQVADYSAQWAEYYRSIGKVDEAEAIEKQMKQTVGGQANPAAATAVGNGNTNNTNAAAAQGMTPSQYAQYSQYYATAAAVGQAAAPVGYPQQAYAGYGGAPGAGGYPAANVDPNQAQQKAKGDKN